MRAMPLVAGWRIGAADRVSASGDSRSGVTRIAAIVAMIAATWFWHVRTTGSVSLPAFALLAGFVLTCLAFGRPFARAASRIVPWHPGVAYELLAGFLCCNTLLFVLTLASPLGMAIHVGLVGGIGAALALLQRRRDAVARAGLQSELGSLACIVFTTLAASLWVHEQQPLITLEGGRAVFNVWSDIFIHVREISAFAQGHGLATIQDIKLAGASAPVYHFASYMMPAALNALTSTTALDSYIAFQLPFGILLAGMAAYVLAAVLLRTTWPAVIGAACVFALPDADQQGFRLHYFAFHFMTQSNLGMLYGLACIAVAWIFMVEACRRSRVSGVAIAYVLLAVCLSYKAHLFVANALLMMLYPTLFFARDPDRIRWIWRVLSALALVALYALVVSLSQASPRMPTLRYDASGLGPYVYLLMGGFAEGPLKDGFHWLYYGHRPPAIVNAMMGATLIVVGSFGLWTIAAPIAWWKSRRVFEPTVWRFVALIVANYLAMAMLLSLDLRGVGTPEEFVNRPQAWAYFVLVLFVGAAVAAGAARAPNASSRRSAVIAVLVGSAMLCWVYRGSHNLQTFPVWDDHVEYAQFNDAPVCLVRAGQYLRGHAADGDLFQDSQFDPRMIVTALAERQGYVTASTFGGSADLMTERIGQVRAVQDARHARTLGAWARANRIGWYLMNPDDADGWDPAFLEQAVFRCEGYRVFRFTH